MATIVHSKDFCAYLYEGNNRRTALVCSHGAYRGKTKDKKVPETTTKVPKGLEVVFYTPHGVTGVFTPEAQRLFLLTGDTADFLRRIGNPQQGTNPNYNQPTRSARASRSPTITSARTGSRRT